MWCVLPHTNVKKICMFVCGHENLHLTIKINLMKYFVGHVFNKPVVQDISELLLIFHPVFSTLSEERI